MEHSKICAIISNQMSWIEKEQQEKDLEQRIC